MKNWFGFRTEFSCAHFYRQKNWSEQKNRDVFGLCFTEYGHGHDYVLEAEFAEGAIAPEMAQEALRALRQKLDHQHLNFVIPEFREQIPTTENILLYCTDRLQQELGKSTPMRLSLWEHPRLGARLQTIGKT